MKISHILMVMILSLGMAQVGHAEHDGMADMHAEGHGLQAADVNKDGVISHDEFTAAHKARSEKMFEKLDANHDGKIDDAERKAGKGKMGKNCKMKGDSK